MADKTTARRRRGRPPGPPVDPAQRREELLDAAEAVLREQGPDAGLADVAAAAGLTRSAVYASFADRNAVLSALATRHAARLVGRLVDIVGGISDPAEQTRASIDILAAWFEDEPELSQALAGHLLPTTPAAGGMVVDTIAAILAEGFRSRGSDDAPAQTWARALIGAVSSTIGWWSTTRTISRDEVVDHLFLLVWSGFSGIDDEDSPDA
ncbi:MAG: TetR/AcrR family transcriptional regulator [Gordonia sp. (in: high G+C Gram-positive bacteria)]|uniref:TetR/AcrR family transcriptional regulator n=1 Tax=Gordonia sp. (in: high G+C Gram-positive bacteria) TaxID=84139 RepID=UPI0039E3BEBE